VAHQLDGGGAAAEGAGAPRGLPLREGHQGRPLHRLRQQGARPFLQYGQRALHPQVWHHQRRSLDHFKTAVRVIVLPPNF
jgi:hypothetical protein